MRNVVVFLDWDSARRWAPRPRVPVSDVSRAARQIEQIFEVLRRVVAEHLSMLDAETIFRVRWRLYHGWYQGKTKTPDYLALERHLRGAKTTVIDRVSFGADVVPGVAMLCGGRRMPLYDTLRHITEPDGKKIVHQKMVDTSLVCDLIQSVRSDREDIHLVFGDDDDLLPGAFMAERWGALVHLFSRNQPSRYLDTAALVTVVTY